MRGTGDGKRAALVVLALRLRRDWWHFAHGLHERVPGWHNRRWRLQCWLAHRHLRSYFQWEDAAGLARPEDAIQGRVL